MILCEIIKNKFGQLESLHIELKEDFSQKPGGPACIIDFSEDGKSGTITIKFYIYFLPKGGTTNPSPEEVFSALKSALEKAVGEYEAKFPSD